MFGMNFIACNGADLEKLEVLQNGVGRLALGAAKWTAVEDIRGDLIAGGKTNNAGPCDMIECMTCKMWVDLEACMGLTEMSQSERNKLVFECWKCMVNEKVKMADVNMKMVGVNMKMEEKIIRLKAKAVSLRR
ncbi:hypothetical protein FHG87_013932 [Trinorchestia longiramus]|nr:hypothetical protein FHG87_013932 [Trinorchestia longiramus]